MSSRKKTTRPAAARQSAKKTPSTISCAPDSRDVAAESIDASVGAAVIAANPGGAGASADDTTAESAPAKAGASGQTTPTSLRAIRLVLVGLAFAGFLICFYLTLAHYRGIIPPCYGTSGCEEVITSRYAVILGVPLSLVGTLYFTIMFYLGIALSAVSGRRRLLLRTYGLLADLGLLAALVLFLLQALILKAYCTYCLTTEVVALLICGGSWWVMKQEPGHGKT